MRIFLCLISLATISWAMPQYNYASGVSGSSSQNVVDAIDLRNSLGNANTGGHSSHGFGGNSFQSSSSSSATNLNQFAQSGSGQSGHFESPLVHKQFITFAGPEDNDNLEQTKHLVIGRPQKNYRVVFIKAPSSSSANVKLSAEYAPKEEKTVIYVLSKNDNQLEISDIATPAPSVPSKPEIFFIKYKTEEEAQHAQKQIQAEYDKIEGSSEHTDGGVAPQQSVIGILGNGNAGSSSSGSNSFGSSSSGSNSFGSSSSGSNSFGSSSSGSSSFGSTSFGSSSGSAGTSFSGGNSFASKNSAYLPPSV